MGENSTSLLQTYLGEGYIHILFESDLNELIMFGFFIVIRKRKDDSYESIWDGDYSLEAISGFVNHKYLRKIQAKEFERFRNDSYDFLLPFHNSGFQFWSTGRALWSTHLMLRHYQENLVHGFFLLPQILKTLWDTPGYTCLSLIMMRSSRRRMQLTSKTSIPSKYSEMEFVKFE